METAVNESLSDPKKTFDASCIQWICDESTIMKVYTQKNINIREVPIPILSWNYFFNSQTFSETYGKENYRTYFADVGTLVNSWNDCFESEINNFKENNYTIHGVGKYLIYLFIKEHLTFTFEGAYSKNYLNSSLENIFFIPSGSCYKEGFEFIEQVIDILIRYETQDLMLLKLNEMYTNTCPSENVTNDNILGTSETNEVTSMETLQSISTKSFLENTSSTVSFTIASQKSSETATSAEKVTNVFSSASETEAPIKIVSTTISNLATIIKSSSYKNISSMISVPTFTTQLSTFRFSFLYSYSKRLLRILEILCIIEIFLVNIFNFGKPKKKTLL